MNTDDTFLPDFKGDSVEKKYENIICSDETYISKAKGDDNTDLGEQIYEGGYIGNGYIICSLLKKKGIQSDLFLVKKYGKTYIAKVYKKGIIPSQRIQSFLKKCNHPNIVTLIENGFYDRNYYEIYEYYAEGTLEDKEIYSFMTIKNIIVPSINEGLKELHKNGIIHCDLKPSNLFLTDNGKRIVIGDLGVSDYMNCYGKSINTMRGTPEYSPPVISLFDKATISPSYDYGSLGLVICRLTLGYSLLGGMSIDEIAYLWDKGIELPGSINPKLKEIIYGLLNKNENARWGYKEVKKWYNGEFLNGYVKKTYKPKENKSPNKLIFGRFNEEIVVIETLHQLAIAIKNNWEQAKVVVKRRELTDFIKRIDLNLAKSVNELTYLYSDDEAVFRLLSLIENSNRIFYKGKDYGTILEYINCLSELNDKNAIEFARSGLLVFYLKARKVDAEYIKKIELLLKSCKGDDLLAIKSMCFSIDNDSILRIKEREITSLNEFIIEINKLSVMEINQLLKRDDIIAWLYSMGVGEDVFKIKHM